jgi:hypothetical protein
MKVLTAAMSPRQNPHVERLIEGSSAAGIGRVIELPEVRGLSHRQLREAA